MRITKDLLRKMKQKLESRMIDLIIMSEEQIEKEFSKVFKYLPDEDRPTLTEGKKLRLVQKVIEETIPQAYCY